MIRGNRTGWIGVDIGMRSVKLAQVERHGSSLALREAAIVPRSRPWEVGADLEHSPQDSSEEMRVARSLGRRFTGRLAACALPMSVCEIRGMKLGEGRHAELRRTAVRELENAAANPGAQREFDHWPVPREMWGTQTAQFDANVISLDTAWTRRAIEDHARAGLACRVLDGLPTALVRAIRLTDDDPNAPIAAIDWGWTDATFCAVLRDAPAYVRPLRGVGYGRMAMQLSRSIGGTVDEARRLLTEFGFTTEGESNGDFQQVIADALEGPRGVMAAELTRTLDYLRSFLPRLVPRRIWLFGVGATIRGGPAWIAETTGAPAAPWRFGSPVVHSSDGVNLPAALFGTAIALSALAWEST